MKKIALILDLDRVLLDTDFLLSLDPDFKGEHQEAALARTNWGKIKSEELLYPEVSAVLRQLKQEGYSLFLFSEGNMTFQRFKINFTGLSRFFPQARQLIFLDKLAVISDILDSLSRRYQVIWLVDDKPSVLKAAKECQPNVVTVLMTGRGPWPQQAITGFIPDHKLKNLTSLRSLLDKI